MSTILAVIKAVLAYVVKNAALLVGVVEAIVKVLGGIISLTPTKKDDAVLPVINNVASWIKKAIYTISDKLAGKDPLV